MSKTVSKFALAAGIALAMALTIGCAGTDKAIAKQQPPATAEQQPFAPAEQPPPAPIAKTPTVDELDISIRDASDYLNENIPKGNKIVILNIHSNSSDLSDYIIDELIANAVNDGFFTVVDRQQLDAIRAEQKFQLSGAVDDKDALAIGKLFGAKTIVSGAVNRLGTGYRIRIRALEVQTAQVQGQFNRNIAESKTVNSLMESGGVASSRAASSGYAVSTATATPTVQATAPANKPVAAPAIVPPPITGTLVPGSSLAEKLAWLRSNAESHNTYILEVNANENIAPNNVFWYEGTINITIVLRGDNENRTIRLKSHGSMFTVKSNVTFILDNNITLHGHNQNSFPPIHVNGGIFIMNNGATITGNGADCGVYLQNGIFEMAGGTISGNTASHKHGLGGGVFVDGGTFTMNDGIISGNIATNGGGVYVGDKGIFTMNGGTISGNTASYGGGVYVGGSPYVKTTFFFNMRGGTIAGNTATSKGGGVYLHKYSTPFTKTGGTITGYTSDQNDGNVVMAGSVLANSGHAVYGDHVFNNRCKRKETTTGPKENLFKDSGGYSGAWDQ